MENHCNPRRRPRERVVRLGSCGLVARIFCSCLRRGHAYVFVASHPRILDNGFHTGSVQSICRNGCRCHLLTQNHSIRPRSYSGDLRCVACWGAAPFGQRKGPLSCASRLARTPRRCKLRGRPLTAKKSPAFDWPGVLALRSTRRRTVQGTGADAPRSRL